MDKASGRNFVRECVHGAYVQSYDPTFNDGIGGVETLTGNLRNTLADTRSHGDDANVTAIAPASQWAVGKDPGSGREYYFNRATNVTQWEKPAGLP